MPRGVYPRNKVEVDEKEPAVSNQPVQTDTTEMDLIPPGVLTHVADQAVLQVTMLADFLVENFPGEINLTNYQIPETPVETAIRLLKALTANTVLDRFRRCSEDYCNRTQGHDGVHGWVESSG
jgi:hypothetical protein